MKKAERILYILNLLRVNKTINLSRLITDCSVSKRTIYRDLVTLDELNFPVFYEDGYRLVNRVKLPPQILSVEEKELIEYCLKTSHLATSPRILELINKIELKLSVPLRGKRQSGKKRVSGQFLFRNKCNNECLYHPKANILTTFLDAYFHRNIIKVKPVRLKRFRRNLKPISMTIVGKKGVFEMKDILSNSIVSMNIHEIADIKIGR